jgi:hypothetical protein
MNWLSIDSYVKNWTRLSREDQLSIRSLLLSDLNGNANRFGLKRKDLEAHLLLNIGCDMTNIVNNGKDSVASNLLSGSGAYSSECLDNRAVDPKTCRRFASAFKRDYSVEKLFKAGFEAYQAVITLDSSVHLSLQNSLEAKKQIQDFFKSNALQLSKMCHKKRLLPSYLRSHEISVSSLLEGEYEPHTHLMFFVPSSSKKDYSDHQESLRLVEEEFNRHFSDRKLEILRDSDGDFKCGKTFASIEKSIDYLFNAYSLASQYIREIRADNIERLNKATVECYHNLIWLLRADTDCSGVQRFGKSHIPLKSDSLPYLHPLLQKKKKSNTIKKESLPVASSISANESKEPSNRKRSLVRSKSSSGAERQRPVPKADGRAIQPTASGSGQRGNEFSGRSQSDEEHSAEWHRSGRSTQKCFRQRDERHVCSERLSRQSFDAVRPQKQLSKAGSSKTRSVEGSIERERKKQRQNRSTTDSSKHAKVLGSSSCCESAS